MSLYEKITAIYPQLTVEDFYPVTGTIILQDDSDWKGVGIKEWHHPTFTKPTEEQLGA